MPGILPMKVIRFGSGDCESCRESNISCDGKRPSCTHCKTKGLECKRRELSAITMACDRCRSKKIKCDGIRPCCSQCANVGFECKTTYRLSRRAFPRGYTESLEERVRGLQGEVRELKDLLDEKDERIDTVALETYCEFLAVSTFELTKGVAGKAKPLRKPLSQMDTSEWIRQNVIAATRDMSSPAVKLLMVETPDSVTDDEPTMLPPRHSFDQVRSCVKPVLSELNIPPQVLNTFGSTVFDKFPNDLARDGFPNTGMNACSTYHIAYGFFSLTWTYFPRTRSCLGILLLQGHESQTITEKLLNDICAQQKSIGHPILLSLLAHWAISTEIEWWLTKHKEGIVTAQSQTGYHHMLAIEKPNSCLDYSQLSATVSGIAVNIATNGFCWQVLQDHAQFILQETRAYTKLNKTSTSADEAAAGEYMTAHATRLARNARFMIQDADSWQKKASIQVHGLFNLIAQRDQHTNIAIARDSRTLAEESKRDSTSMKAIAAVTMVFLPGTFTAVSTLFSYLGSLLSSSTSRFLPTVRACAKSLPVSPFSQCRSSNGTHEVEPTLSIIDSGYTGLLRFL
jgi:hypothetical protein